ncbi:ABC transporter permease [Flavobacteriaceae bacterium CRH]|nr:ABC transporter permease [Flavobacteriaceae bacterium CRH]
MLALLFKNFIRSKGTKIGLLFLLLIAFISLLIGQQFQQKQSKNITEAALYQKEHIARNAKYHKDEMGLLLYYIKFSLVNKTLPINSLAIGQRDVNPSIQSVTIRGFEAQKYDSELNNPSNLLLGNIDFSFVLIYLFPLLIIAFTYNIVSEEKESGTWKIVATQTDNTFSYILKLFYIRILSLIALLTIVFIIAIFLLKIPFNQSLFTFYILSVLYILFWFAVCFYIVSLQKNSNFNAVILLTIWLFMIIILPATINTYIVNKYPVPEALELTLKQRNAYHEKWDMDKKVTLDKFYKHYPQFKSYVLPDAEFSWLWYYAMQQMGDDESAVQSKELETKLEQRNQASHLIAQFVPTLHTQIQLNEIAKSDLENQLLFLKKTKEFHEKMRLYFYPKIFDNTAVEKENWSKFKVETFSDESKMSFTKAFLPLLVFNLLLIGFGWRNFKLKNF